MKALLITGLCVPLGLGIFACTQHQSEMPGDNQTENTINVRNAVPDIPLSTLMDSAGIGTGSLTIYIDKSALTLSLLHNDTVIKTYPVVLGGNPVGDKRMEGDQKTPEGEFQIRNLYPHAKWSKFLWVNYPTDESWEKFNAAKANGEIPQTASIGGEIGIHGVPEGYDYLIDQKENWTLGCISLKNAHIDEIYAAIEKWTKVVIVP